MADADSSLPVRTQSNGDIAAFLADGTTPSQLAAVDTHGSLSAVVRDASGNAVTSQANGGQRSLDTRDQADGPVAAGTAASFSMLIGGQHKTSLPTLSDGQQSAIQVDASGRILANVTSLPTTVDTNYGTVGASSLRIASQIGNATGAADFNYGAVGAQTVRVASQVGNATGAADYNNGATGAQTLRVAANLAVAGANVTSGNPVPVIIIGTTGTPVNSYKDASAIAASATDNHDYTVTALKTLTLMQVEATASGKAKMQIQVETSAGSGTFTTVFTQFNSTAETNMSVKLSSPISVAAGVKVRIVMTNRDNQSQDLYSTICGTEA